MDKVKETLGKIFANAKDKWTELTAKTRIVVLAVAGVVIVSAFIITVVLNGAGYTVIYTAASQDEAREILNMLSGIGYSDVKSDSSNRISVSSSYPEAELRMQLASEGYPRDGTSNFNNDIWNTGISVFSTESQQRELQRMQLQAWLQAAYNTIPDVDSSIVILDISYKSDYAIGNNEPDSGATIKLNLASGKKLSSEQIEGVKSMARTAVPRLEDNNITLTDGYGTPLIADDAPSVYEQLTVDEKRYAMEREFQVLMTETLEMQLNKLLTGVFRQYTSSVTPRLDFSDKTTVETTYTPIDGLDTGVINEIIEKYAVGGTFPEGLTIGTAENSDISPNYPTYEGVSVEGEAYAEWLREVNYKVNEKIEEYYENGMRLVGLNASVVVDSETMAPADIEMWTEVIANAIGANPEDVSFQTMSFPLQTPTERPDGTSTSRSTAQNVLVVIIICLGVLLIILLILAILTSGSKKKRQIRYRGAPPVVDGAGNFIREDVYTPVTEPAESFDLPSLLDNETETKDIVLKREIREFSNSNPEIIAQLIRTWLRTEE